MASTAEVRPRRLPGTPGKVRLHLLGGFRAHRDDQAVAVPLNVQRVLAYIALQDTPVGRRRLAAVLWGDSREDRADGSLRSALWRLSRHDVDVVVNRGGQLALAEHVIVDVHEAVRQARRLLHPAGEQRLVDLDHRMFIGELLPDWLEDWVLIERERLRQLCLHALEALARQLLCDGQHGRAVEAAVAAVRGEPLRESAHRTLAEIHLAEGNRSEAIRQYDRFRRLLADELGVRPSPQLERLVHGDGGVTSG
jgi:DNA-binding SARP family transcriptional activator